MSQKFWNILIGASLWHEYHMNKEVEAMVATHNDW